MNFATENLVFDPQIIRRFDVNGPRYTSYPTADRFVEAFDSEAAKLWLGKRNIGGISRPLSLYFHIPFCNTICYYCACNKIITKDHGRSAKYLKYLAKELDIQAAALEGRDGEHEVIQLHWGGGTPTFLSHDEMRQLMAATRKHFKLLDGGEYSIEVDPRKVDDATVALLGELGFNRMSVGVQDFDEKVQVAVNRVQSEEETASVINAARANGFKSVSVDLIYGLPHQTVMGFNRTLERGLAMNPDRLSVYNYAHMPSMFKPQRRIAEADLPSADTKLQILALAIKKLTDAGYVFIGMDHFAKPNDELAVAQRQGRLHRNFQGYSTYADCDLISCGVSAISAVGATYSQNEKTLEGYYEKLDEGRLPVVRGIKLENDDLLRRILIQKLMCNFELSIGSIEQSFPIRFSEYFATELEKLKAFEEDGLLIVETDWITGTPKGRLLIRNICMAFDRYLSQPRLGEAQPLRYSKTI